jgi:hypothetical protein
MILNNVQCAMFNFWTLMCLGIISIGIGTSKCRMLNIRSYVPTFAPKITTLRILRYDNVMVLSVHKFGSVAKDISFFSCMTPSIRS